MVNEVEGSDVSEEASAEQAIVRLFPPPSSSLLPLSFSGLSRHAKARAPELTGLRGGSCPPLCLWSLSQAADGDPAEAKAVEEAHSATPASFSGSGASSSEPKLDPSAAMSSLNAQGAAPSGVAGPEGHVPSPDADRAGRSGQPEGADAPAAKTPASASAERLKEAEQKDQGGNDPLKGTDPTTKEGSRDKIQLATFAANQKVRAAVRCGAVAGVCRSLAGWPDRSVAPPSDPTPSLTTALHHLLPLPPPPTLRPLHRSSRSASRPTRSPARARTSRTSKRAKSLPPPPLPPPPLQPAPPPPALQTPAPPLSAPSFLPALCSLLSPSCIPMCSPFCCHPFAIPPPPPFLEKGVLGNARIGHLDTPCKTVGPLAAGKERKRVRGIAIPPFVTKGRGRPLPPAACSGGGGVHSS